MLEVVIGSLTFSIMGSLVLLAQMVSERMAKTEQWPDREPVLVLTAISKPVKAKATRRGKTKGVQQPSKHMTLGQLEQIKADNYCGKKAEYFADEVDAAILARSEARADRFVTSAVKKLTFNEMAMNLEDCPF